MIYNNREVKRAKLFIKCIEGNMKPFIFQMFLAAITVIYSIGQCDTFTPLNTGQTYHGFATQKVNSEGKTLVHTTEKGKIELDLKEYKIEYDYQGRNNSVAVITVDRGIISDLETTGFEQGIAEESDKGPLFILIEFGPSDGLSYLSKRMVSAIERTTNCKIIGLIVQNDEGGVCGTGIPVVLACNEIYMSKNSVLKTGRNKDHYIVRISNNLPADDPIHNEFGTKLFDSPEWQDYVESVAKKHKRPALMARGFFDKNIEIQEINRDGKLLFVSPEEKQEKDKLISVLTKSGYWLTLTEENAVAAGMVDGIASSREQLFEKLNVKPENIIQNRQMQTGRKKYDVLLDKCDKDIELINQKVQLINSQVESAGVNKTIRTQVIKDLKFVMQKMECLIKLKENYPDLIYTDEEMKKTLSTYKNLYDKFRTLK